MKIVVRTGTRKCAKRREVGKGNFMSPHTDMQERDERWELASRAAGEGIWDWDMRSNRVYQSDCWFEPFG